MAEPKEPMRAPRPGKRETTPPGRFVLQSLALLGMIALLYWVGWRSPWARADQRVHVQLMDPPKQPGLSPVQPADKVDVSESGARPGT